MAQFFFPATNANQERTVLKSKGERMTPLISAMLRHKADQTANALTAKQLNLQQAEMLSSQRIAREQLNMQKQQLASELEQNKFDTQLRMMGFNTEQQAFESQIQQRRAQAAKAQQETLDMQKQAIWDQRAAQAYQEGNMEEYFNILTMKDPENGLRIQENAIKQQKMNNDILNSQRVTQGKLFENQNNLAKTYMSLPEGMRAKWLEINRPELEAAGIDINNKDWLETVGLAQKIDALPPLSGEAREKLSLTISAEEALGRVEELMPNISLLGTTAYKSVDAWLGSDESKTNPSNAKFVAAVKEAGSLIGKLRSGAALNESEMILYYEDLMPKWNESQETKQFKINQLKRNLEIYQEILKYGMIVDAKLLKQFGAKTSKELEDENLHPSYAGI